MFRKAKLCGKNIGRNIILKRKAGKMLADGLSILYKFKDIGYYSEAKSL